MEKFTAFIENYIAPPLVKIGQKKLFIALRAGMMATLPATMVGALFLLIANFPVEAWQKIVEPYQPMLGVPVSATYGMLGLIVCGSFTYSYAKELKIESYTTTFVAMFAFIMMQFAPGATPTDSWALNVDGFGASGLFLALITAFVTVQIKGYFARKGFVIKLPENVPPAVSRPFESIIPAAVIFVLVWLVRVVANIDVTHAIQVAFSPLVFMINSLPGYMVMMFLVSLLWSVGLHGDSIVGGVLGPVATKFMADNVAALQAHQALPFTFADGFDAVFLQLGGTGATMSIVLLLLMSKVKRFKQLGELALPSSIFNISEPIVFGLPLIVNPIMMLPFLIVPQILTACTWVLMNFGLIGKPCISIAWVTPPILSHYLITGGDWRAAVWGACEIVIAFVIYLPFFRVYEKLELKAELKMAEEV